MAGRLFDLSQPAVQVPPDLIVDSSVALDWLLAVGLFASTTPILTPGQLRATRFVGRLQAENAVGFVTSASVVEIFHVLLKTRYRVELPNYQADLLARYPNVRRHGWDHLYKARSDLVKQFAPDLDRARRLMLAHGLLFLQPEDLDGIPSGRSLDDEMIRVMARYELDTSDAAILIEAQRAGIASIVTSDVDLLRAQLDFDLYSWL